MSKSANVVRVELRSPVSEFFGVHRCSNVYVNADVKIKEGDHITLSDSDEPDRFWTVVKIHEIVARTDIKQGWNNNI